MKLFLALAIVAFVGCAVEGRAIQARDAKDTLITKGNDLLKKADEAVKKLTADHKTHEASVIKTEEAKIKKLVADLEAATDDAKIKTLEHQLSAAEHKLQFDLQKANHTPTVPKESKVPTKRAAKDVLITKGNDLLKKADEAIVKLEASKKTHEITIVKTEEAKIKKLIADLQAATDDAKVTQLEHELSRAEHQLQFELQKIEHGTHTIPVPHIPHEPHILPHVPAKRDAKSDLITKANDLLKKADAAITHLRTGTHLHEVAIVKNQEERIKKLVADLEAATDDAKITQLEHELTRADHQLEHELTLIQTRVPTLPHHPRVPHVPSVPTKRAAKDALITKGNGLLKKADEAIKKLEADKKTHEVTVVKTEEAKIKKLIADLEAATDDAKVKTIEHDLSTAEHKLEHELAKIAHPATPKDPKEPKEPKVPTKRDTKSDLITKANDLLKKADAAITHLRTGTHLHEVAIVKHQEERIKKLISDLEAATDDAKVTQLEHELTRADHQLEHELTLIQGRVPTLPHLPRQPHLPVQPKPIA